MTKSKENEEGGERKGDDEGGTQRIKQKHSGWKKKKEAEGRIGKLD